MRLSVVGRLYLGALCLAPLSTAASQIAPAAADTAGLEFLGFRAGAALGDVEAHVRSLDGGRLRCDRAKADRRVLECRALLTAESLGGPVELWLSAIDSVTGVLTLSGDVAAEQFDDWRATLERRYGRVGARVQGSQWMMQWVRRRRMIRLTWRVQQGERVASVSLVDGRVLDGWQAPRKAPASKGKRAAGGS
jgi:hypothetical protein